METPEYEEGEFILERFNPIRASRGVGAAEVTIRSMDLETTMWMTQRDIERNLKEFGPQQGLLDAKKAYELGVRFDRMNQGET